MIHSVEVIDPECTPAEWWPKVPSPLMVKGYTFKFKPGINILWGPNGSGKSTVIKSLARSFHCEESGFSVITEESIQTLFSGNTPKDKSRLDGLTLKHDGQAVRYYDPAMTVGLIGGMAAFDYNFMEDGVMNATMKASSGQTGLLRFKKILDSVRNGDPGKVVQKVSASTNGVWGKRLDIAKSMFVANAEKGGPTVLLDEPDRSLDIPNQRFLWALLRHHSPTTQFIIASHGMFGIDIPGAHYIEMIPGYLADCRVAQVLGTDPAHLTFKAPEKKAPMPEPMTEKKRTRSKSTPTKV